MVWYLIGGGPSASLIELCPPDGPTATTNAGLGILPTPTYYYVTDVVARERYRHAFVEARNRGTRIVTPRRNDPALMGVADIIVDCDHGLRPDVYHPGKWTHPALSGCGLVQFAANMGARTIRLFGFDGYPIGQPGHRFNALQEGYLQSVAAAGVLLHRYTERGVVEYPASAAPSIRTPASPPVESHASATAPA